MQLNGDRGIGTRKDGHFGSGEHYARVERERIEGEPLIDAILRTAYEDFYRAYGSHSLAAAALGTIRQTVARHLDHANQARLNTEIGRSDLNKRWGWSKRRRSAHIDMKWTKSQASEGA